MSLQSLTSLQRFESGRAGKGVSSTNLPIGILGRNFGGGAPPTGAFAASGGGFGLSEFNVLQIINPAQVDYSRFKHQPGQELRGIPFVYRPSQDAREDLLTINYRNIRGLPYLFTYGGSSAGLLKSKMYNRVDAYPYVLATKVVSGKGGSGGKGPSSLLFGPGGPLEGYVSDAAKVLDVVDDIDDSDEHASANRIQMIAHEILSIGGGERAQREEQREARKEGRQDVAKTVAFNVLRLHQATTRRTQGGEVTRAETKIDTKLSSVVD